MNGIYLLLGSNLGNRLAQFSKAVRLLEDNGVKMLRSSVIYETEPWGNVNQPSFLNAVIEVSTKVPPRELLAICLGIEIQLGRKRGIKWGARNIDIDILFYHNEIIAEDDLIIPHPGIPDRQFTLLPICDLAANERHPLTKESMQQLLDKMPDDESCKRTELHLAP